MYRVTPGIWLDCPLERVTTAHDVTLTTPCWDLSSETDRCNLRVEASSPGRSQLESGIRALRDAGGVNHLELKRKRGSYSTAHVVLEETVAIEMVPANGDAAIGPFRDRNGQGRWHPGSADADATAVILDSLDRRYELAAVEQTSRSESLASLDDRCGVSDVAISKTLRRAKRKLPGAAVFALVGLDGSDPSPDSGSNSDPDSNSDPNSTNARSDGGGQHPNPPALRDHWCRFR